jgi:hypothetical protein
MSDSAEEYWVKGSSIKSKLEFVRERFGPPAEAALKQRFASQGLFLILESEWYPYALFDELCVAIAENHYGGALERLLDIGVYSAERALRTTYEAYLEGGEFLRFLARIPALHGRLYNQGRMEVSVGENGRSCEIHLRGAPLYTEADTQVAAGFYVGAARTCGLKGVQHRIERRDDGVDFFLNWTG